MSRIVYIFLLSVVLMWSCDRRPGGIPSQGRMEDILYDYYKAQSLFDVSDTENSEENEKYILGVLDKYGLNSEMFDSAMVWYTAHPDQLQEIYHNLEARLKAEDEEMQAQVGRSEMTALYSDGSDTTNLWNGAKLIALRPDRLHNLESFTLKADTSYHKSDHFHLNADIKIIKEDPNSPSVLTMNLSIRTKDGKVYSQTSQTGTNDIQRITINQSSDSEIDEISGYFYYKGDTKTKSVCIINGISLIRMHVKEEPKDTLNTDSLNSDSILDNEPQMQDEYPGSQATELPDNAPGSGPGKSDRQNEVEQIKIEQAPQQNGQQDRRQRRISVQESRRQGNQGENRLYDPYGRRRNPQNQGSQRQPLQRR